jgi:hypothetical protein
METVKSKDTHDFLEESDKRPLVLITGITGYIGVHVAK